MRHRVSRLSPVAPGTSVQDACGPNHLGPSPQPKSLRSKSTALSTGLQTRSPINWAQIPHPNQLGPKPLLVRLRRFPRRGDARNRSFSPSCVAMFLYRTFNSSRKAWLLRQFVRHKARLCVKTRGDKGPEHQKYATQSGARGVKPRRACIRGEKGEAEKGAHRGARRTARRSPTPGPEPSPPGEPPAPRPTPRRTAWRPRPTSCASPARPSPQTPRPRTACRAA